MLRRVGMIRPYTVANCIVSVINRLGVCLSRRSCSCSCVAPNVDCIYNPLMHRRLHCKVRIGSRTTRIMSAERGRPISIACWHAKRQQQTDCMFKDKTTQYTWLHVNLGVAWHALSLRTVGCNSIQKWNIINELITDWDLKLLNLLSINISWRDSAISVSSAVGPPGAREESARQLINFGGETIFDNDFEDKTKAKHSTKVCQKEMQARAVKRSLKLINN